MSNSSNVTTTQSHTQGCTPVEQATSFAEVSYIIAIVLAIAAALSNNLGVNVCYLLLTQNP
jgi:hypothetical protein